MYAIYMVLYLPIVIYIPALALGQVTNLNIHLITPIVCGVCIFYTTLGGLKAVVWTDVIQFGVMLGSMLTVIIVGIQRGGGFMNIVRNSYHGGRLNISYELDFLQRDSFWAVFFGQAVQITSHFSVGQSTVQKFMSLSAFKLIKITLVWAIIGMSVIVFLSILSGLLMYSNYMNCDPVGANLIKTNDQILPFYVMEQASFIPGLCGLFISGIFSAGLSTLSAIMNCLSATLYEDFISPFVPKNTSQKRISQYLKLIVVAIGITSTALVYVVEKLGSLAALTLSFTGITSGPILGLFCVGMVLPQVTAKGALSGGIVSLCIMAWVILTAQWYKTKGIISYPSLPVSTSGCNKTIINTSINNMFINTTNLPTILDDEEPFAIYRVSFYWYAAMGLVINVIVSLAVSCFTKEDKPLKRNCISPIMQFLIVENGNEPPQYDEVAELVNLKNALVGVYYGFIKKQNTAQDYLLGGKEMKVWPISMSLVSRFNNKVRIFASFLYALSVSLFLPVVIYTPALALGQVTSLNVHLITPIVCGVCIFYTTLGGLRAVVLTDVIQFGVMFGSLLVVIAIGVWSGGGFGTILKNSYTHGQLDISFDLDFLKRDTFWAVIIGQSAQLVSYFGVGQGSVQKFLSLPSFEDIKTSLIWSTFGIAVIQALSVFCGVLMFSKYINCDPLQANVIKSHDQILPLYVMEEVSFIPGLCGLFISGIFSAGLSTLSALMNCLAATIYEDFVSPFVPKGTSQKKVSQYLKLIVVILGIESTAMVYVVEKMGGIVQLTLSFSGVTSGPILGLFCAGMLLPQVTAKGALAGGIISVCVMGWIILTSQWYKMKGVITYPVTLLSTDGCNDTIIDTVNNTVTNLVQTINGMPAAEEPFFIYKVSFYWYAIMGLLMVVLTSLVISYFTEHEKPLNKDCISPIMHFLINDKYEGPPDYDDVALEKLNQQ
ncbi:hypothetical protein Trydic_g17029 [Trypoxylus dichotomus]